MNHIQSAMQGDQQAFSIILKENKPRLLNFINRMTNGDRELSLDILQETWLKSWRNIHLYDGSPKIFSWLAKIAKNLVLDHHKKSHTRFSTPESHFRNDLYGESLSLIAILAASDKIPDETLEKAQKVQQIKVAMEIAFKDHPMFLEMIELRFFKEMHYEEIAETLQISIGTVKSRLHQAKAKLKVELVGI